MFKTKENLSLKTEVELYGVTIRKMPNGAYFRAIQSIRDLPENFVRELGFGENVKLSELLDAKNVGNIVLKMLEIAPRFMLNFLSELLNIDKDKLENELTPVETVKIIKEFWRINELDDFFEMMKPVLQKISPILALGFNAQSQFASK